METSQEYCTSEHVCAECGYLIYDHEEERYCDVCDYCFCRECYLKLEFSMYGCALDTPEMCCPPCTIELRNGIYCKKKDCRCINQKPKYTVFKNK